MVFFKYFFMVICGLNDMVNLFEENELEWDWVLIVGIEFEKVVEQVVFGMIFNIIVE